MTTANPHTASDGGLFDDAAFRRDCETLCERYSAAARAEDVRTDILAVLGANSVSDILLAGLERDDPTLRHQAASLLEDLTSACHGVGSDTWCAHLLLSALSGDEKVPADIGPFLASIVLRYGRSLPRSLHVARLILAGLFHDALMDMLPHIDVSGIDASLVQSAGDDLASAVIVNNASLPRRSAPINIPLSFSPEPRHGTGPDRRTLEEMLSRLGTLDLVSEQYLFDCDRARTLMASWEYKRPTTELTNEDSELLSSVAGMAPAPGIPWPQDSLARWRHTILGLTDEYSRYVTENGFVMMPARVLMTLIAAFTTAQTRIESEQLGTLRTISRTLTVMLLSRLPPEQETRQLALSLLNMNIDGYLAAVRESERSNNGR